MKLNLKLNHLLLLGLLGAPTAAHAQVYLFEKSDPWSTGQVVMEAGFQAALLCNWQQVNNGYTNGLTNILGPQPDHAAVNAWYFVAAVSHATISYMLPSGPRTVWQGATLIFEGCIVAHNVSVGAKLTF